MRGKKSAELEMGYCPFEHWLGRTRRLGAHSERARGWALGRWGAQAGARARRRELGYGREGRSGVRGTLAQQEHAGRAACRLGRARRAVGVRKALGARAGCKHAACAHLGVLAGLWAMHLVQSAYF